MEVSQNHYHISATEKCSTHIHISLDPIYTLPEIKRVAQAVIHFETAFEALVPAVRRNNHFVKSNWLDSSSLVIENKTRSQIITEIDEQIRDDEVALLIQKRGDRDYAWNFWALFTKRTIEFRKPPASTTSEEVLAWAELAISFIQASIKCESAQKLQMIPATIGGLRWFVSLSTEPGVNEPQRMHMIWDGKDSKALLAPTPNPQGYWHWQLDDRKRAIRRLRHLALADENRSLRFARRTREPYW